METNYNEYTRQRLSKHQRKKSSVPYMNFYEKYSEQQYRRRMK